MLFDLQESSKITSMKGSFSLEWGLTKKNKIGATRHGL